MCLSGVFLHGLDGMPGQRQVKGGQTRGSRVSLPGGWVRDLQAGSQRWEEIKNEVHSLGHLAGGVASTKGVLFLGTVGVLCSRSRVDETSLNEVIAVFAIQGPFWGLAD